MKYLLLNFLFLTFAFGGIMDPVEKFFNDRSKEFDKISEERKSDLKEISKYISESLKKDNEAKLTFICTHNSRRSHLAQLLTAAAADYYKLNGIKTYSGGTESTAFNKRAVAALERVGFSIENPGGDNPKYEVRWRTNMKPNICFSKKYDDKFNPDKDFAAIMVCSSADEACPYVAGANQRISIPYEDPKAADGTDRETIAYDNKVKEIAREMMFVMSKI